MSKLAMLGGQPVIDSDMQLYRSIDEEETQAVNRVLKSGMLSGYIGAWCDAFDGGNEVRKLERAWEEQFKTKHAIAVNSNTSGLISAMGAIGVSPGDEVIVPPWSMSATVVAPMFYGGIPVFADIEEDTFCLDPESVRENITTKTRAILVVDLFGHAAQLQKLRRIADEHGIYLIEDNAQAPLATENGHFAGTVGDIGVFSLNYHKHIHTGEGGICVTDDDELALRLRGIRNHGENIVEPLNMSDSTNMLGFNFRMTEMSAAIGVEQLIKAEELVSVREEIASHLSEAVSEMEGITPPKVRSGCRHVYYLWSARFDAEKVGVSRQIFSQALAAEGCPNGEGYVEPLYLLPMFQQRKAIGRDGFPFNLTDRQYDKGLCPVVERLHEKEQLEIHTCSYQLDSRDLDNVISAFQKVYDHIDDLRTLELSRQ
jgi:dTDP-4-amino-4,6-dideoxygalactose transaminase